MNVTETIMSEEPAVHEMGADTLAAHSVDQYLPVRQFQFRNGQELRNDKNVIDSAGTVSQAPRFFRRVMSFNGNAIGLRRNID